jgi:hypothetical protein
MSLRIIDGLVSELLANSYLWVWSDWSDRSMMTDWTEWNHECQLACPISESAAEAIVARPDWTIRVPLHYSDQPYARCVWQRRVMIEILSSGSLFTLVAHAVHPDDATDAIQSFSDAIYDGRPQVVSWKRICMSAHWGMEFEPLPDPEPPSGTSDELDRRSGEIASRWLIRRDFASGAPRVVFVSSEDDVLTRQFFHDLAAQKRSTDVVFVYPSVERALIIDRVVHPGVQRLRIIQHAGMRRAIVVIDDIARLLRDEGCNRLNLLRFMAALVHGMHGNDQLPQIIGLLPNSTCEQASALLPQRWHPYDWFHLPGCSNDAEPTPDADAHEQHKL